ncbi:MAG TPA: tetratricopeptide repeat protein [Chthoniobacterales bacterium]|nr:tetratricopeptide repeat protein [Chthoniobacterales bacterium]
MAVKTEKELSETQRTHWLKAVAAIELRNFGYAISLLQGILKQEPEFLSGRQLLRRTEVTKSKAAKRTIFNISTAPLAVMKAQREMKKDPKRAIEMIEKVLEEEPYHQQANLVLKQAAVTAGWPEIAVFALETLLEENPRDVKVLYELARLHRDLEQSEQEVEICNRLSEIDPLDAEASRLGKNAAARASMATGGWTQAESYRDLIKDKKLAVSLEQQSRTKLSGEALDQQIAETSARQQAEPRNVDLARRLGVLNEQKDDIAAAIKWYQYAVNLTTGSDAELVRKVSDLKMKEFEREIAGHEEFLATDSGDEELRAKRAGELATAKKKRAEILIDEARKRVDRNPTNPHLRLELAEHLVNAGRFREALPGLQRARQNPSVRLKAMNLLGRCYQELGMLDLAAKQLEEAAKGILSMDAMKKEIVYNLARIYETMGDKPRSLNCMKQIYEADSDYKDVAVRVESSYE